MRFWGFPCKTPGCEAWLKVGELQEDTLWAIRVPINLGGDLLPRKCPACGETHDYAFSEKEFKAENAFTNSSERQMPSPTKLPNG
jgi:hypothetical protein